MPYSSCPILLLFFEIQKYSDKNYGNCVQALIYRFFFSLNLKAPKNKRQKFLQNLTMMHYVILNGPPNWPVPLFCFYFVFLGPHSFPASSNFTVISNSIVTLDDHSYMATSRGSKQEPLSRTKLRCTSL